MNIKELINFGKTTLEKNKVEDAGIIARVLAQYILKMDRNKIVINENSNIEEIDKHRYYLAIIEIIQGMPLQYITNSQEFYGIQMYVNEKVLIPQPDTEILVQEVIKIIEQKNKNKEQKDMEILDMCTGSGCIAVAIATNVQNVNVMLADVSREALEIAKVNAQHTNTTEKFKFIQTNMFENVEGKFDIIVSNPPYIETDTIKSLDKQVQNEPLLALDGGKDGLKFYRILVNEGYKYLNKDGYLCMEIGYNQKQKVEELLKQNEKYTSIYTLKDFNGNDRVVIAKLK